MLIKFVCHRNLFIRYVISKLVQFKGIKGLFHQYASVEVEIKIFSTVGHLDKIFWILQLINLQVFVQHRKNCGNSYTHTSANLFLFLYPHTFQLFPYPDYPVTHALDDLYQ